MSHCAAAAADTDDDDDDDYDNDGDNYIGYVMHLFSFSFHSPLSFVIILVLFSIIICSSSRLHQQPPRWPSG